MCKHEQQAAFIGLGVASSSENVFPAKDEIKEQPALQSAKAEKQEKAAQADHWAECIAYLHHMAEVASAEGLDLNKVLAKAGLKTEKNLESTSSGNGGELEEK